jgi:predicted dehydrogenase
MDVYTEAGTFSMANDRVVFWGVEGVENPAEEVTSGGTAVAASAAVEDTSAHERMIADLAAAARLGREPVCPASQARFATALIRAVYAAARQGRPVCPDGA